MAKLKWMPSEKRMLLLGSAIPLLFVSLNALYEWNNRVPALKIPHAAPPRRNAFDSFQQATKAYVAPVLTLKGPVIDVHFDNIEREPPLYSPAYDARYPISRKQAFLRRNAVALHLLRQGLTLPYVQPPERDLKTQFDSKPFNNFRDLLLVEAHARAQSNNWDGAADSLLDLMHSGYVIPHGGTLIPAMRGIAMRTAGAKQLRLILPHLSASKAREAARKLEGWRQSQVSAAESLEEDKRAMQATIVELIRSRDFRPLYVSYGCIFCNISNEQYQNDLNALDPLLKMRLAWMNKARLIPEFTRCMDWQIAEARKPYSLRSKTWPFPDSDDQLEYLIYQRLLTRAPTRFDLCETQDAFLTTMLALHAYRLEKRRYPAQLSELVPRYLPAIPLDPFSNRQSLRYNLRPVRYFIRSWWVERLGPPFALPNGPGTPFVPGLEFYRYDQMPFRLYSVGFNARDNGGVPYEDERRTDERRYKVEVGQSDTAKCDIVEGINHT